MIVKVHGGRTFDKNRSGGSTIGNRHAEYQGDKSRWVDLTPEQKKQAYDNMWTE